MTSDLHDLWRERQAIGAALDSGLLADDDPAWERFPDLDQAIRGHGPLIRPAWPSRCGCSLTSSRPSVTLQTKRWLLGSPWHSKSWAMLAGMKPNSSVNSLRLPQVKSPRPPSGSRCDLPRSIVPVRAAPAAWIDFQATKRRREPGGPRRSNWSAKHYL